MITEQILQKKIAEQCVMSPIEVSALLTDHRVLADDNEVMYTMKSFDKSLGLVCDDKMSVLELKPYFSPEVRAILKIGMRQILEQDCSDLANKEDDEPHHRHLFFFLRSLEHLVDAANATVSSIHDNFQIFNNGVDSLGRAHNLITQSHSPGMYDNDEDKDNSHMPDPALINKLDSIIALKNTDLEIEMISCVLKKYRKLLVSLRSKSYF